jgi:hypothetical protein
MIIGGEDDDIGIDVAWYSDDSFIVIGYTDSDDFPIYNAYQDTRSGESDMFIMKLNLAGLISTTGSGFTLGLVEGVIIVGIVGAIVILVLLKKRSG